MQHTNISGRVLARNSLLNLIGQAIPLVVGFAAMPFIIQGLGTERFGLLSLIWIVLGYFTIFDLGLGRATTKYVAEALGKGNTREASQMLWTAVTIQAIVGIAGTLVIVLITPGLVQNILNITPSLHVEAKNSFYTLALSVPVILISTSFSGALAAVQRFDLINAVKIPSTIATYIVPLVGGQLGWSLPLVIGLLIAVKTLALISFSVLSILRIPDLKQPTLAPRNMLPKVMAFGGWITVSVVLAPSIKYLDRFIIGSMISITSVAYYTTPFDTLQRLWIIPMSMVLTLFPAFSALSGMGKYSRTRELFVSSVKYLLALSAPIFLVLILFARQLLSAWLGHEFMQNSIIPFQILAASALIGIVAPVTGAILDGYGRPDIVAKVYLVNAPINLLLVWYLTQHWGLAGAALTAVVRTCIETAVLIAFTLKVVRFPLHGFLVGISRTAWIVMGLCLAVVLLARTAMPTTWFQVATVAILLLGYAVAIWRYGFNGSDRRSLRGLIKRAPDQKP